jgi:hypothetical protein
LAQRRVAGIDEAVWHPRRNDDDVASFHGALLVARHAGRASVLRDDDFIVIVLVELGSAPRAGALTGKNEMLTPCFSPTNSCDIPTNGNSSPLITLITNYTALSLRASDAKDADLRKVES